MIENYLDIHPEVINALQNNIAVVALESTIIAHGMPYPQNLETAKKIEGLIREYGAVPATIGILNGRIKVGMSEEELMQMANSEDVQKVSRRDIASVVSRKKHGATTVAATMIIAEMAGIEVFVTGGIGGVHRGGEETFDISADLEELAKTNVTVVCAGAKSILDIGLTLEYLETKGVPVIGYGCDEFPAFYTSKSGFGVDERIDDLNTLAVMIKVKRELKLKGGVVVGNPIPENADMEYSSINKAIERALKEAEMMNIRGKKATPFLLSKIVELTGGKSLEANIQLVLNNAKTGAMLANSLLNC